MSSPPCLTVSQYDYLCRLVSRQLAHSTGQKNLALDLTEGIMAMEPRLPGSLGTKDRLCGLADLFRTLDSQRSEALRREKKREGVCPDTLEMFPDP